MPKMCRVPDCDRPVKSRELCGRHYDRALRAGTLDAEGAPANPVMSAGGKKAQATRAAKKALVVEGVAVVLAPVAVQGLDYPPADDSAVVKAAHQAEVAIHREAAALWERRARVERGEGEVLPPEWEAGDGTNWSRDAADGRFLFVSTIGTLAECQRPYRYRWSVSVPCPCPHQRCTEMTETVSGEADWALDAMTTCDEAVKP